MNKVTDHDENDDVVVIEQRDKKTYIYIAIASVLGLALGGLVGSSLTANQWQEAYQKLETQYQSAHRDKEQMASRVEDELATVHSQVQDKLDMALVDAKAEHEKQLLSLQAQVQELEKVNLSLEEQVSAQKKQIADANNQNTKLNHQADVQATLLERSRELFQRELKVKQQLEALQKERDLLEPKLPKLKEECDLFLDGTSWDVKSDSCDKQDEANSRLSQIDQMIRVHQMDLEQIKSLSEQIGL